MIDTGTEQLLCEVDDGIALVTFNNPAKHNALSAPIRAALPDPVRARCRPTTRCESWC